MVDIGVYFRMRLPKKFLSLNRSLLSFLNCNRVVLDIGLNLIMMARIGDQIIFRSNDHFSADFLSFNIKALQAILKIVDYAQKSRYSAGLRI